MSAPIQVHLTEDTHRIVFASDEDVAKYPEAHPPTLVAPETVDRWKAAIEAFEAVQEEMTAAHEATWKHVQVFEDMEAEEEEARWREEDAVNEALRATEQHYLDTRYGSPQWVIVQRYAEKGTWRSAPRFVGATLHHQSCASVDRVVSPSTVGDPMRVNEARQRVGKPVASYIHTDKPIRVCGRCQSRYDAALTRLIEKGIPA